MGECLVNSGDSGLNLDIFKSWSGIVPIVKCITLLSYDPFKVVQVIISHHVQSQTVSIIFRSDINHTLWHFFHESFFTIFFTMYTFIRVMTIIINLKDSESKGRHFTLLILVRVSTTAHNLSYVFVNRIRDLLLTSTNTLLIL